MDGVQGLLSRRGGMLGTEKSGGMWMRSDGDAWEYGEEGDAGKEDILRNILQDIPPALTQQANTG